MNGNGMTLDQVVAQIPDETKRLVDLQGDIGVRISQELETQGKTINELADKVQIHPSTLKIILAGQRNLTLMTIVRIEVALGIKLVDVTELR